MAEGPGVKQALEGGAPVPLSSRISTSVILSHLDERRHPLVCLGYHRHHGPTVAIPHLVCPITSFFSSLSPIGGRVLASSLVVRSTSTLLSSVLRTPGVTMEFLDMRRAGIARLLQEVPAGRGVSAGTL